MLDKYEVMKLTKLIERINEVDRKTLFLITHENGIIFEGCKKIEAVTRIAVVLLGIKDAYFTKDRLLNSFKKYNINIKE